MVDLPDRSNSMPFKVINSVKEIALVEKYMRK